VKLIEASRWPCGGGGRWQRRRWLGLG